MNSISPWYPANRDGCRRPPVFLLLVLLWFVWPASSLMASNAANPLAVLESSQDLQVGGGASVAAGSSAPSVPVASAPRPFVMAILSDLHVREENWKKAVTLVEAVNAMKGIEAVALLGDLCEKVAAPAELKLATRLVRKVKPPVWAIPGNHDYLYDDKIGTDGKKSRGSRAEQRAKLERFTEAFGQKHLRFTKKQGGHLLVFLPTDALQKKPIACLSDETLDFLEKSLDENPDAPTVVFAHAPLEGSYEEDDDDQLSVEHATSQPADRISAILKKHPQVFLWVAGHRHTKPGSKDYFSKVNQVGNVTCVHVPNITPEKGWVLTLALTPEHALVRTWDLQKKKFIEKYNRRFVHKQKPQSKQGDEVSNSDKPVDQKPTADPTVEPGKPTSETNPGLKDMQNWFEKGMQKFTAFINRFFNTLKKFFS